MLSSKGRSSCDFGNVQSGMQYEKILNIPLLKENKLNSIIKKTAFQVHGKEATVLKKKSQAKLISPNKNFPCIGVTSTNSNTSSNSKIFIDSNNMKTSNNPAITATTLQQSEKKKIIHMNKYVDKSRKPFSKNHPPNNKSVWNLSSFRSNFFKTQNSQFQLFLNKNSLLRKKINTDDDILIAAQNSKIDKNNTIKMIQIQFNNSAEMIQNKNKKQFAQLEVPSNPKSPVDTFYMIDTSTEELEIVKEEISLRKKNIRNSHSHSIGNVCTLFPSEDIRKKKGIVDSEKCDKPNGISSNTKDTSESSVKSAKGSSNLIQIQMPLELDTPEEFHFLNVKIRNRKLVKHIDKVYDTIVHSSNIKENVIMIIPEQDL